MSLTSELEALATKETNLSSQSSSGKVANFSYTDEAYQDDQYEGHSDFVVGRGNNIPLATSSSLKTNQTVLDSGYREQGASIVRHLANHFFGRVSYNLNKAHDNLLSFISTIKNNLGEAEGIATLDSYGTVPSEQIRQARTFTYVVNSDASLAYWLTNKSSGESSGGNDFTSVLIKKGEWNFTGNTIALNTIGTLYIEGEPESELVFTNTLRALQYSSLDITTKRAMHNVTINCRHSTNLCTSFYNCSNLTNCTGSAIVNGVGFNGFGFESCFNLTNCIGTGYNTDGSGFSAGFTDCTMTHGCRAGGHCTHGVFFTCYASWAKNSTYACADTANGGFNDTINPSA